MPFFTTHNVYQTLQAAITRMQYVHLRVTNEFIELIALGLEDRLALSYKDYIGGINAGPCALNIMDILFGDCLIYNNTFGSFMLHYSRKKSHGTHMTKASSL